MNLEKLNSLRWDAIRRSSGELQYLYDRIQDYITWLQGRPITPSKIREHYSISHTREARIKEVLDSLVRPIELEDLEVPDVELNNGVLTWEVDVTLVSNPGNLKPIDIHFKFKVSWDYSSSRVMVYPRPGSPIAEGSCHPHVRTDGLLCLGEGQEGILRSFLYGSPLMGIQQVNILLGTYNPAGPYRKLSFWRPDLVACSCCKRRVPLDTGYYLGGWLYCLWCVSVCAKCNRAYRGSDCPRCEVVTCLVTGREIPKSRAVALNDGGNIVFVSREVHSRRHVCLYSIVPDGYSYRPCIGTAFPARCTICQHERLALDSFTRTTHSLSTRDQTILRLEL